MDPRKMAVIQAYLLERMAGKDIESKLSPNTTRAVSRKEGVVGVIPIQGIIDQRAASLNSLSGGASTERISKQFEKMIRADDIKAVVFDIDSPGGSVYGVSELADQIRAARGKKPIIASVNSLAASAAYWIASAADEIAVTPGGEVGSIGVYTIHFDESAALEAEGVKATIVSAGKFKTEGNPWQPLSDEAREAIQTDINHYYDLFVSAVAKGRGVAVANVRSGFGQGRTVTASLAVDGDMADRIETLPQTLARLGVDYYQSSSGDSGRSKAEGFLLAECEHDYFLTMDPIGE